jgi:hypothetical protein
MGKKMVSLGLGLANRQAQVTHQIFTSIQIVAICTLTEKSTQFVGNTTEVNPSF